jgi:hypothetical protein
MNKSTKWLTILAAVAVLMLGACQSSAPTEMKEISTQDAGALKITLSSASGELTQGQNQFDMMFRSAETGQPVDVGTVMLSCSMSMPGMAPMVAPIEMMRDGTGHYMMHGTFGMSGSWMFNVQWDGPGGKGSTSFHSGVR